MSIEPSPDCPICPRLHDFIAGWRAKEPAWHNAPVPAFLPAGGIEQVQLLIIGLAPGLRGANRTGRPFTGDYAGDRSSASLGRLPRTWLTLEMTSVNAASGLEPSFM